MSCSKTCTDKMDPGYLEDPSAGIFAPVEMDKTLDMAIIGAGIAGLAAAAGLLRSGHRVEIFERSKFSNEVGAAIHVCPNASRVLIPTENLVESEVLRPLFENVQSGISVSTLGERRLVWYPCRSGQLQNFVGIHPEKVDGTYKEEWNVAAPLEALLDTYKDFNPAIVEICKRAEDLKLWKLLFRAPISSWTKDRVILIGDAAHPMLPHQGRGGGQTIEDGAALGALFSHIKTIDETPQRLQYVEEVRMNRASAIQMFSNAGQDEAGKIEDTARPYVKGPIPKTPEDFHNYNFSSNVFRDCIRVLEAGNIKVRL